MSALPSNTAAPQRPSLAVLGPVDVASLGRFMEDKVKKQSLNGIWDKLGNDEQVIPSENVSDIVAFSALLQLTYEANLRGEEVVIRRRPIERALSPLRPYLEKRVQESGIEVFRREDYHSVARWIREAAGDDDGADAEFLLARRPFAQVGEQSPIPPELLLSDTSRSDSQRYARVALACAIGVATVVLIARWFRGRQSA